MFSYAPLAATLHRKHVTKSEMRDAIGASSTTLAKISKDEFVSLEILDKICTYLGCKIEDVIQHVNDVMDESEDSIKSV